MSTSRYPLSLLGIVGIVLVWSAINPHDYFTWLLEVIPALIASVILLATFRRFRLTNLTYSLIAIHAVILMIGGHYTYAEVPLFNWLEATFDLARNYYDRIGHLAQGFVPAVVAREIFLRLRVLPRSGWLTLFILSFVLAFSAFYELIEWWVAAASGTAAESFLGTQGDPWDTQWDMFLALVGGATALLLLSKTHDRALARLSK
jgi:putative membrane protein